MPRLLGAADELEYREELEELEKMRKHTERREKRNQEKKAETAAAALSILPRTESTAQNNERSPLAEEEMGEDVDGEDGGEGERALRHGER